MAIKAIGFDWGGVIGAIDSSKTGFTERMAEAAGVEVEQLREEYFQINHLVNAGVIDNFVQFDKILLSKLGKPEKLGQITKLRQDWESSWTTVDPRMVKLVKLLRSKGYKVGLLSNSTKDGGRRLRQIQVQDWFDVFMISAEEKIQKPEPELFRRFAKKLGVELAELIYIDDAEKSLARAKELGYYPILFRGYEKLEQELEKLDVLEKKEKTS